MSDSSDSFVFGQNASFVENLYDKYLKNQDSVDTSWKKLFSSLNKDNDILHNENVDIKRIHETSQDQKRNISYNTRIKNCSIIKNTELSVKAATLINAFRLYGHKDSCLNPLSLNNINPSIELDYKNHGIKESELDQEVYVNGAFSKTQMSLRNLYECLLKTYSSRFAVEFTQIDSFQEREWLRTKIEDDVGLINYTNNKKLKIINSIIQIEMFEEYLNTKFPTAKRFSIEGSESAIIAIEEVIESSASHIKEVVFGMSHRGRLSVLTKVIGKPYRAVFSEFKDGTFIPKSMKLPGDVKYHVGFSTDIEIDGHKIHLTLTPNPSHLELVNSVVLGRVRAKQDLIADKNRRKVMGILLHGDAAFCAQGSVMESLALSGTKACNVGGTIHIIINNQIGFTTDIIQSRSSRYCTDIAKMIGAPIFHVNGDDPEAVAYISKIASEYRLKFQKDVFIDIVCYRRYGHNEGDEPMFTQPKMYNLINKHQKLSEIYLSSILEKCSTASHFINSKKANFKQFLDKEFQYSDTYSIKQADWLKNEWQGFDELLTIKNNQVITGVNNIDLQNIADKLTNVPRHFNLHPRIQRVLFSRNQMLNIGKRIDWGMGETLAYATLLKDGYNIRMSGEDIERGTFSHRHAVLTDQNNEVKYIPLNNLYKNQKATLEIHNSILSELAVMGFEYGYSYSSPNTLVIWEAQFGDFANGAQMIIDQYLVSSKEKWLRINGLVLFLPHGYDGQGPEHSSARLERYLGMCAKNNICVANCTTPASMFHLLRRQMLRTYKNPLIIMTPKSLLRNKSAVSELSDFLDKTFFYPVIGDSLKNKYIVKTLIFCSGQVYYHLLQERDKQHRSDIALIRLEELYPYPERELKIQINQYKHINNIIWCQEEPKNMGAWHYIKPRFDKIFKDMSIRLRINYVGRDESVSPAAGYAKLHLQELNKFLHNIFLQRE